MSVYEGGIHVPFIISGAGVQDPGRTSHQLVHTTDIFATVLDIMDSGDNDVNSKEQENDSYSLKYILENKLNNKIREYVISELEGPNGKSCDNPDFNPPVILKYGKTIINSKYFFMYLKLLNFYYRYKLIMLMRFENGQYMEDGIEFYDLENDPFEENDLLLSDVGDLEVRLEFVKLLGQLRSMVN